MLARSLVSVSLWAIQYQTPEDDLAGRTSAFGRDRVRTVDVVLVDFCGVELGKTDEVLGWCGVGRKSNRFNRPTLNPEGKVHHYTM